MSTGKGKCSWLCVFTTKRWEWEASAHVGVCHRRGAASFSKLPLKENLSHQDRRANIKGAGNRRENLYKQCLCREEELWTWTRSQWRGLGGRGPGTEPGNRKLRAAICFMQIPLLPLCWQRQNLAPSQQHKNILYTPFSILHLYSKF